jgi:hypothetical protein
VPVLGWKNMIKFNDLPKGLKSRPENSLRNRQIEYSMSNFWNRRGPSKPSMAAVAQVPEKP